MPDINPVKEYAYGDASKRGSQYGDGMFAYLKKPYANNYQITRGASDFGNMSQYNLYESGYPFLVLVSTPKCLDELVKLNADYGTMVQSYYNLLEHEFRGIDGLENITSDTGEITDGISTVEMITKVNQPSNSTFTMRFMEKAGSTINKTHELYLRGIKDPRTQFKTYNGLIPDIIPDPGFEKEVFSFLYFVTDNTGLALERAFYIVSAQITTANLDIYESEKGTIEFKEVGVEFRGYPLVGPEVNRQALKVLKYINDPSTPFKDRLYRDSSKFSYTDNGKPLSPTADIILDGRKTADDVVNDYKVLGSVPFENTGSAQGK